jgi:oligogalacturonide transport system ATP-binding protein
MEHLLDRYPKQLSGGQAQRVAVGRAIVKKPEVFLFDEPLSNLDAKLRAAMRVRLTELHRTLRDAGQPATVVYVTHDQVEAMTMGERICVLKAGVIQQVDTPPRSTTGRPMPSSPASSARPEMNIQPAALQSNTVPPAWCWAASGCRCRRAAAALAPAGAVQLGLRPEHISVAPTRAGDGTAVPALLRFAGAHGQRSLRALRHRRTCR